MISLIGGPWHGRSIDDLGTSSIRMGISEKWKNDRPVIGSRSGQAIYEPSSDRRQAFWLINEWDGYAQKLLKMNKLQEQIENDFKEALRNGEKDKLSLIRSLKSAFGDASLKKGNITEPLSLEEVANVIRKQIDQRNDSIKMFLQGKRTDLANREKNEVEILSKYLPEEISDDCLNGLVWLALQEYDEPTRKDTGNIIVKVYAAADGNVNRKRIAKAVNVHLR